MERLQSEVPTALLSLGTIFLVGLGTISFAAQHTQHPAEAHRHPAAAKLKNPVPAIADSIAAGHALFDKHCAPCHGDGGKGDGMMGEDMDPRPADLTDDTWIHGSSDGEIFAVIRDGTKTGMKSFRKQLNEHRLWDLVNYIRSIGPKAPKSN